mmetsp:Transcript_46700/g.92194  ORF Transcript_46700/g.92194 Transcript_46700/m.92194 type:complete len:245 (+) Transcript_46700:729-1463(+)
MENWVCGCVDQHTGRFRFRIMPPGRCARTKNELTGFVLEVCDPCTFLVSDALRAYCPRTLARAGILHESVKHSGGKRVSEKKDESGAALHTQRIESLWNRIRFFLGVYNLQRQQPRSDLQLPRRLQLRPSKGPSASSPAEPRPSPLSEYLHEWTWKWNEKIFQRPQSGFAKLIEAIRLVQSATGFPAVLRRKKNVEEEEETETEKEEEAPIQKKMRQTEEDSGEEKDADMSAAACAPGSSASFC